MKLYKKCTKCGKLKEYCEFSIRRTASDRLQSRCKACNKAYRKDNNKKIKACCKRYREANKNKIKRLVKIYYEKNRDDIIAKSNEYRKKNKDRLKKCRNSHTSSYKLLSQLPQADNPLVIDEIVTVICKNCGKRIVPTLAQVKARIGAINGRVRGEANFYCGDECKNSCPLYGFKPSQIDPRSRLYVEKSEQQETRLCQTKVLKHLQCDSHGYNYCERCGDIIDVELHHTLTVAKYGKEAVSNAGHILLCAGCHVELHNSCALDKNSI